MLEMAVRAATADGTSYAPGPGPAHSAIVGLAVQDVPNAALPDAGGNVWLMRASTDAPAQAKPDW